MRIILKGANFSQNGIPSEDYQIQVEKSYNNVIANLTGSAHPDEAQVFNGWTTYFFRIPEGITTIKFEGEVEKNFGGSLVKDVVLGDELPTYTNTGRNVLTTDPRSVIRQTLNLEDYPGTTHLMYSANSAQCQVTYEY